MHPGRELPKAVEHHRHHGPRKALAVISINGDALLGEHHSLSEQRRRIEDVTRTLVPLTRRFRLVICHGGTPAISQGPRVTMDPGAIRTFGLIAHTIALHLVDAGVEAPIACVLTTSSVPYENGGLPLQVLEQPAIRQLVAAGTTVICAGAGGVPVNRIGGRTLLADGEVDEDLLAATIARSLGADYLLMLSDVEGVYKEGPDGVRHPMSSVCVDDAAVMPLEPSLAERVNIAVRYVDSTGGTALIGPLSDPVGLVDGHVGTSIWPAPGQAVGAR